MISKGKLFKYPNYLLSKYQSELYRQLRGYMDQNNLTQKEVAKKLDVSTSYINQILKGNFNYTLKKLIELSLLMGKVPKIEFVSIDEYWANRNSDRRIVVQKQFEDVTLTYVKLAEFSPEPVTTSTVSSGNEFEAETYWAQQSLN